MGLFSRKPKEPHIHAAVARRIHVEAALEAVAAQLQSYSELHSPKHADTVELTLGRTSSGETVVRLPAQLHPWTFHNIAFWLLDTPGLGFLAAVSGPSPSHPGYVLTRDPDMADCLCGHDASGDGWTVEVPMNWIARPDAVPVPQLTEPHDDAGGELVVSILCEDPGDDMNPNNDPTEPTRKKLAARHQATFGVVGI